MYEKNEDGTLKLDANGDPILKVPPKVDPPVVPPVKDDKSGELDLDKLDEKTRNYIKDLRKESGGYRTKAKAAEDALKGVKGALGLEGDQASPEEKAKALQAQVEQQQLQSAILTNAFEHGVPKEGLKYFSYMVNEAMADLKDGEELSETKIAELAVEAKSKAIKPKADSSVNGGGKGGGTTPPPGGTGSEPTVEAFAAMNMAEKSKIFTETPELYERLWKTALEKKLIK